MISIVFEKILDILCLSTFSIIGILLLGELNRFICIVLLFSVGIIAVLIPILLTDILKNRFLSKFIPIYLLKGKLETTLLDIHNFFYKLDRQKILHSFLLSFIMWGVNFSQIYLIFRSVGLFLDMDALLTFIPISLFIGMLPLTVSGIGTRDGALLFFLSPYAPLPLILSGSFLITFVRLWLFGLIGLVFTSEYLRK